MGGDRLADCLQSYCQESGDYLGYCLDRRALGQSIKNGTDAADLYAEAEMVRWVENDARIVEVRGRRTASLRSIHENERLNTIT